MGMQIFLGMPSTGIEQWIIDHRGPVADSKTYIKFSDGTEFYDVIEFPDGLDGVFDLRTAVKYGWTTESSDGYNDPPAWYIKYPVEVILGSNVTSIGDYTFQGCNSLTSITIPDSVMNIGTYAFSYAIGLTNVEFEGNAPTVGTNPFIKVATGCKAVVSSTATGFPAAGETWNGLIVEVKS